jgi:hypothetical protein
MASPWAFGWTQLFTILGFFLTTAIAIGGFRTFGRWKREKIEEKRIDAAVDALTLRHEVDLIFDDIRAPMTVSYEWDDMPAFASDDEQKRRQRGPHYAVLMRVKRSKEFFERAIKLQIKCAALFGAETGEAFLLIQRARREIEVSADILIRDPEPTVRSEDNNRFWEKMRGDLSTGLNAAFKRPDPVGDKLTAFKDHAEKVCRPVVYRGFGKTERTGFFGRIFDWLGL